MTWVVTKKSWLGPVIVHTAKSVKAAQEWKKAISKDEIESARKYASPKAMWHFKRRLRDRYEVVEMVQLKPRF